MLLFQATNATLVAIEVSENSKGIPVGICGKSHFFTFRSEKSFFLLFNCPTNITGGRLNILLQFPNNWYNNIDGQVEKIKTDFLSLPNAHKNGHFCPFLCAFGKGKKSVLIFSTYPSILLYQLFGNWRRMSNLPSAIFIGQLNAEKQFFGSKSEK